MESLQSQVFLAPRKTLDGLWVLVRTVFFEVRFPDTHTVAGPGKVVGPILAELKKCEGKIF